MNRKLTATLLILAAVLANVGFSGLGSIFDYPDVLNRHAATVLASFRDHETAVSLWFVVLAVSAGLLAPIAIGVRRLSPHRLMRIAMPVGIAAAAVQVIGLMRWPVSFPATPPTPRAPVRAPRAGAGRIHHREQILGTTIGETFGYVLTATWTLSWWSRSVVATRAGGSRCSASPRGPRDGGRARALGAARRRHRELLRLRAVELLARRLRCRDPRARPSSRPRPRRGRLTDAAESIGARHADHPRHSTLVHPDRPPVGVPSLAAHLPRLPVGRPRGRDRRPRGLDGRPRSSGAS